MKKGLMALLILLLLIYSGSIFYFYDLVVHFNDNGRQDQYERFRENFDPNLVPHASADSFSLQGAGDAVIRGQLIPAAQNQASGVFILSHGITTDRWDMARFVQMYHDSGFHVVVYDLRNHGLSSGSFSSYGYYEKQDLRRLIHYWHDQFPELPFGLHGVSMGAATVLQTLPLLDEHSPVKLAVADCPYSTLYEMLKYRMKEDYEVPNLALLEGVSLLTRLRLGFWLSDVSPVKAIRQTQLPVLFIHGEADSYVPYSMGKKLYETRRKNSRFLSVPDATHAKAFEVAPERYKNALFDYWHAVTPNP